MCTLTEQPEDGSDELALEGADRLPSGLLLGPLAGEVGLGRGVMGGLDRRDGMERPVEVRVLQSPFATHITYRVKR